MWVGGCNTRATHFKLNILFPTHPEHTHSILTSSYASKILFSFFFNKLLNIFDSTVRLRKETLLSKYLKPRLSHVKSYHDTCRKPSRPVCRVAAFRAMIDDYQNNGVCIIHEDKSAHSRLSAGDSFNIRMNPLRTMAPFWTIKEVLLEKLSAQ